MSEEWVPRGNVPPQLWKERQELLYKRDTPSKRPPPPPHPVSAFLLAQVLREEWAGSASITEWHPSPCPEGGLATGL